MVNEEKVYLMTQAALDETARCRKEIQRGHYYKPDYIRSHVLEVVGSITVSYLFVLVLIALYYADYIFLNIVSLDYARYGLVILGIYIAILTMAVFFSYFHYEKKYSKVKIKISNYNEDLKKLEEFYLKSREEAEDDAITGV